MAKQPKLNKMKYIKYFETTFWKRLKDYNNNPKKKRMIPVYTSVNELPIEFKTKVDELLYDVDMIKKKY